MLELYVPGMSKKQLNVRLDHHERIIGYHFTPMGKTPHVLCEVPDGTIIKVFDHWVGSEPSPAKAYGVMNNGRIK